MKRRKKRKKRAREETIPTSGEIALFIIAFF
jgi:hypothetical protein